MKYKINYKANDGTLEDEMNRVSEHIFPWFESKGYESWDAEADIVSFISPDERRLITMYLGSKLAKCEQILYEKATGNMNPTGPGELTKEELQLLDSLDFELTTRHKRNTGQSIEGWF